MSIQSKALLTKMTISRWSGTKTDTSVGSEVARNHQAQVTAGQYTKRLVDPVLLSDFNTLASKAYSYHQEMTLPWLDGGWRVLPTSLYFEYTAEIRKMRDEASQIVNRIGDRMEDIIADGERRLGTMFDRNDYPSKDEIISKFNIDARFMPVPETQDFRVDVGEAESAVLRQEIEEEITDTTKRAITDIWDRAYSVLQHLYDQLSKDDRRLMQRSFTVVNELADFIPKLNIFGDEELDRVADEMRRKLSHYRIETLRGNPDGQKEAAESVNEILERMASYGGVKKVA